MSELPTTRNAERWRLVLDFDQRRKFVREFMREFGDQVHNVWRTDCFVVLEANEDQKLADAMLPHVRELFNEPLTATQMVDRLTDLLKLVRSCYHLNKREKPPLNPPPLIEGAAALRILIGLDQALGLHDIYEQFEFTLLPKTGLNNAVALATAAQELANQDDQCPE